MRHPNSWLSNRKSKKYKSWYRKLMEARARPKKKIDAPQIHGARFVREYGTWVKPCEVCGKNFQSQLSHTRHCPACRDFIKQNNDPGFVYFIECGEFVKVGKTGNMDHRMSSLAGISPHKMRVLFAIKTGEMTHLEREMHKRFKSKRHKREWFRLETSDLLVIRREYRGAIVRLPR